MEDAGLTESKNLFCFSLAKPENKTDFTTKVKSMSNNYYH